MAACAFFLSYNTKAGNEWKLDISFWLGYDLHPELVQDALEQQLTPELRLPILWIKDLWYQLPTYRTEVSSTDIYDAVLQHNVHTPAQFDVYLAEHSKPTRLKGGGGLLKGTPTPWINKS